MNLSQKTVLLTGGSSGIGRAIAKSCLEKGAQLIVFGQHVPNYECQFFQVNVGLEEEIRAALDKIDRVDALINNAGIAHLSKLEEIRTEELNQMLEVNFKGVLWMCKYTVPKMPSGANIINVSSIAGIQSYEDFGIYCATKAAVISLTKTLAIELAPKKIRVNAIAPGAVETSIWNKMYGPEGQKVLKEIEALTLLKRIGNSEEIAQGVQFLIANDFTTGSVLVMDGGELCL